MFSKSSWEASRNARSSNSMQIFKIIKRIKGKQFPIYMKRQTANCVSYNFQHISKTFSALLSYKLYDIKLTWHAQI